MNCWLVRIAPFHAFYHLHLERKVEELAVQWADSYLRDLCHVALSHFTSISSSKQGGLESMEV